MLYRSYTPHLAPWIDKKVSLELKVDRMSEQAAESVLSYGKIVYLEKLSGIPVVYHSDWGFRNGSDPGRSVCDPYPGLLTSLHYQLRHRSTGATLYMAYTPHPLRLAYPRMNSFLHVYGARLDGANDWLEWTTVEKCARKLGLPTVPKLALADQPVALEKVKEKTHTLMEEESVYGGPRYGVVVRLACTYGTSTGQYQFLHPRYPNPEWEGERKRYPGTLYLPSIPTPGSNTNTNNHYTFNNNGFTLTTSATSG
jgi:hypothetical protein